MFGFGERFVVGYDLSTEYAQISYMGMQDAMPETVTLAEGREDYNIPACLFKRMEVNQWFFGREAKNYSSVEEGTMVDNLLEHALVGDKLKIGEDEFDHVALLALFIKRSMTLLKNVPKEKIAAIMFTVPDLTKRAIEVLESVTQVLGFDDTKIFFVGRQESIFYYVIHQQKELWKQDVLVYDFSQRNLKGYHFCVNRNSRPQVAVVDETIHPIVAGDVNKDSEFCDVIKIDTKDSVVSGAFLIGNGFEDDWCHDSLKELCRGRRVFKGNNLYSKGACYAARERLIDSDMNQSLIFLGKDKLKANIGMNLLRGSEESYYAILDGGESWYDAKKEFDIILDKDNTFEILITPLDGRNVRSIEIVLDGLTQREAKTTRLHLNVFMESDDRLRVCATDMGFGEFYPTTYQLFTRQIEL
ncbi:MAG: hypothetical protein K5921_07620 [Lachnospiraceae bacterium]|nr:hypothetical protein [Lachnospiraceae bacterium]